MASTKNIERIANIFRDSRIFSDEALRRYGISLEEGMAKAMLSGEAAKRTFRQPNVTGISIGSVRDDILRRGISSTLYDQHGQRIGSSILVPIGRGLLPKSTRMFNYINEGPVIPRSVLIPKLASFVNEMYPQAKTSFMQFGGKTPHVYMTDRIRDKIKTRFTLDMGEHNLADVFDAPVESIVRPPTRYLLKLASVGDNSVRLVGREHPSYWQRKIDVGSNPRVAAKIQLEKSRYVPMPKHLTLPTTPQHGPVEDLTIEDLNGLLFDHLRHNIGMSRSRESLNWRNFNSYAKLQPVGHKEGYMVDIDRAIKGNSPYASLQSGNPVSDFSEGHRPNRFIRPSQEEFSSIIGRDRQFQDLRIDPRKQEPIDFLPNNELDPPEREYINKVLEKILKKRYFKE